MDVSRTQILHNKMLKGAIKRWSVLAITATAGTLYSCKQFCNCFTSDSVLYAYQNDDTGWLSSLLSKKDSAIEPSLSDEKVNIVLRRQEFTKKLDRGKLEPISWFETNHYNANSPIEDRHCECMFNLSDSYFFGLFDGHSGWHCSESLRLRLPLYLSLAFMSDEDRKSYVLGSITDRKMVEFLGNPKDDCPSFAFPDNFSEKQKRIKSGSIVFAEKACDMIPNSSVSDILKYTYLAMDRDITREAIPDGKCNEPIWTGLSGAVAVGAYIKGTDLYIANTGDCRAIIGVQSGSGKWFDIPLSEDHTADNINETIRINSEHPSEEETVIFNGRLLGQLQPLRSFGDVVYKWTKDLHKEVLDVLYGRPVVAKHLYRTPPYLTAQPDVTHKKIEKDDRFIILATDGLWDILSNEKAVNIVGEYLDDLSKGVKQSENGATKLIRYALGQGNKHRVAEMLQLPAHCKRNYHDDITVTIIYLDRDYRHLRSKL